MQGPEPMLKNSDVHHVKDADDAVHLGDHLHLQYHVYPDLGPGAEVSLNRNRTWSA